MSKQNLFRISNQVLRKTKQRQKKNKDKLYLNNFKNHKSGKSENNSNGYRSQETLIIGQAERQKSQ